MSTRKAIQTAVVAVFPAIFSAATSAQTYVSSFSGGPTTLVNSSDSAILAGLFGNTATSTPAPSGSGYAGTIGVSVIYVEPSGPKDSSITVSGEPASIKLASGSGVNYTRPSDFYATVTFDFSSLENGTLPAGTFFNIIDLDGNTLNGPVGSQVFNLTARDSSGTPISSAWLGTSASTFDYGPDTTTSQPSPGTGDYPTWSQSSGVYAVQGQTTATATPVISWQLAQNVKSIQLSYFGSAMDNTQFNFSNAIPAPEPSSMVFTCFAGAFAMWSRRRRKA